MEDCTGDYSGGALGNLVDKIIEENYPINCLG